MKKDVKKKKDSKPKYEVPVILDLGELARGAGGNCIPGASNIHGRCRSGGMPARSATGTGR